MSRQKTSRDAPPPPTALASTDPPRNFTLPTEERVRALTIGPPAYALRKRAIEDYEAEHVQVLVDLHDELVAKGAPAEAIARAIRARAASIDVSKMNRLVGLHNRWYPVEANLAMDRHGNFLVGGRVWAPEPPYDAARLVALAEARLAARQPD